MAPTARESATAMSVTPAVIHVVLAYPARTAPGQARIPEPALMAWTFHVERGGEAGVPVMQDELHAHPRIV
jgi:hypothetical protein